jgi:hypothetical protein
MVMGNLKVDAGINKIIQQDSRGEFQAGWERNNVRSYYGYGFEGFVNPFLWNKMLKGISANVKASKNLRFNAIYGTAPHEGRAVQTGMGLSTGNGFLDSNYLAQIGAHYRMKGTKCYLGCQQIQHSALPSPYTPSAYKDWEGSATTTYHTRLALENQEKTTSFRTMAYTGVTSHKVQPGVELNCALTCAPTPDSLVMKWSVGAVSKPKGLCAAYGLNLGTPAYVHQSDVQLKDEIPLVCEASAHFSFWIEYPHFC